MWFEHMSDEQMLLALCIREDELDDPAAWCSEFRAYSLISKEPQKSATEAEALMARADALFGRGKKASRE